MRTLFFLKFIFFNVSVIFTNAALATPAQQMFNALLKHQCGPQLKIGPARDIYGVSPIVTSPYGSVINDIVHDPVNNITYIAGNFKTVMGQTRKSIAAIDMNTGLLTPFDPSVDGIVQSLSLDTATNRLYAGGSFNTVNDDTTTTNGYIADSTGARDPISPTITGGNVMTSISDAAGGWFIGGSFTTVNGISRNGLARINSDGSLDSTFNPTLTSPNILSLYLAGSDLYIGGSFSNFDGQGISNLARFDIMTDTVNTSWKPVVNGAVRAINKEGNILYIGGDFTTVESSTRYRAAALDVTLNSGMLTSWNPVANNTVYSLLINSGSVYLGGSFYRLNYNPLTTSALFNSSGSEVYNLQVDGQVYTSISDGAGGFYIGGSFTTVNGVSRAGVARINSDGTLNTAFNPGASGTVRALYLNGTTLYIGGSFATFGGQALNKIASYDTATNTVITTWNPNIVGTQVNTIDLDSVNNILYIGGIFTTVNGNARTNLFSISTSSSTPETWAPNPNAEVKSLVVDSTNSLVYLGGNFTTINSIGKNYLAAIPTSSNSATSWTPNPNFYVNSILLNGSNIIAGGSFTQINSVAKSYLAEIPVASNSATAWNPNPDSSVVSLNKPGTKLYVGGNFNFIFTELRKGIAEIDFAVNQNALTSFTGAADANIITVSQSGSLIFAGSSSQGSAGGVVRNNLGSVNNSDGLATNWKPVVKLNQASGPGSSVYGLAFNSAISPTSLFVGGYFLTPGLTFGQISLSTGAAETPPTGTGISNGVYSVLFDNNKLYLGGSFGPTAANGAKGNVAIYDYTAGSIPLEWVAPVQGWVYTLSASTSNKIFIGGGLVKVGNKNVYNLAAFDTSLNTGNLINNWSPKVYGRVYKLLKVGTSLYVGGSFTNIDGSSRSYAAALDTTNNTTPLLAWNPVFNNYVDAMTYDSSNQIMYMGGYFTTVNGASRDRVAGVYTNINTNNQTSLSVTFSASSVVYSLALDGNKLYVAGAFTTIDAISRNRLARITINGDTTGTLDNFNPNLNAYVQGLFINGNQVYVGGAFTTMAGGTVARNRIAVLDKTVDVVNSTNALKWDPNIPTGPSPTAVFSITKNSNNQILFGGSFYNFYGDTRYHFGQVCAF